MKKQVSFTFGDSQEENNPLDVFKGNVAWIRTFERLWFVSQNCIVIARVDEQLQGVSFGVDYAHKMFGHARVEQEFPYVRLEALERDRVIECVFHTDQALLTPEEINEHSENLRKRAQDQDRREQERVEQEAQNRRREYERLKKEFEK